MRQTKSSINFEPAKTNQKKFTAAHEQGAQEFTSVWLRANEVAVDAIRMAGGDVTDLKTKTMTTLIVLRVLVLARFHYTGQKKATDPMPITDREKRIAGFAFQSGYCGDQLILLQDRLDKLTLKGAFDRDMPIEQLTAILLEVK